MTDKDVIKPIPKIFVLQPNQLATKNTLDFINLISEFDAYPIDYEYIGNHPQFPDNLSLKWVISLLFSRLDASTLMYIFAQMGNQSIEVVLNGLIRELDDNLPLSGYIVLVEPKLILQENRKSDTEENDYLLNIKSSISHIFRQDGRAACIIAVKIDSLSLGEDSIAKELYAKLELKETIKIVPYTQKSQSIKNVIIEMFKLQTVYDRKTTSTIIDSLVDMS